MRLVLDASDLREKGGAFYSTLIQGAKEAVRAQANEAHRRIARDSYFKNRSGRTLRSFSVRASGLSATIESKSPIAVFMDLGTQRHPIVARLAPMLVFYWAKAGGVVRFKIVRHPGTKPRFITQKEASRGVVELYEKATSAAQGASRQAGLL